MILHGKYIVEKVLSFSVFYNIKDLHLSDVTGQVPKCIIAFRKLNVFGIFDFCLHLQVINYGLLPEGTGWS